MPLPIISNMSFELAAGRKAESETARVYKREGKSIVLRIAV
jgi:hypothetical protein